MLSENEKIERKREVNRLHMAKKAKANPEAKRAYERAYRAANKDKIAAIAKKGYERNREKLLARGKADNIKKYGLTPEQHKEMFEAQGSCCALCKSIESGGRGWHIDHCHETNKVRSILCHHCNVGLGHFKDNSELLRLAADYLERHRNNG